MNTFIESVGAKCRLLVSALDFLQSPFLLLLRIYFFWPLFQTGQGKLTNLGKISDYFASLDIPFPGVSATITDLFETFVSLLLIFGLPSRLTAIPITSIIMVPYLTPDFKPLT